jgi:hypothetical protein
MTDDRSSRGIVRWLIAALVLLAAGYVPSSGPVLAAAFWLREATGWDGFYGAIWLYYPLFAFGRWEPLHAYIEWWVELFGTVGPG